MVVFAVLSLAFVVWGTTKLIQMSNSIEELI